MAKEAIMAMLEQLVKEGKRILITKEGYDFITNQK